MAHPECCAHVPKPDPHSGVGHVEKFGGLRSYISGPHKAKHAILLIPDSFGFESPILRNLADKVAAAGFFVVAPDFLHNDPYDRDNAARPFVSWSNDHPIPPIIEDAKKVLEGLRHKGIHKIGCASFCWAAQILVGIDQHPLTNAAALLHPAFISVDDVKGITVPLEILAGEKDVVTTVAVIKEYEDALKAQNTIDYNVKIFAGAEHGFAVKYDTTNAEAVKTAEEAQKDMFDWLLKYIH